MYRCDIHDPIMAVKSRLIKSHHKPTHLQIHH